jgi:hypothetical protein
MALARILLPPAIQEQQEDRANADCGIGADFRLTIRGSLSPQHQ